MNVSDLVTALTEGPFAVLVPALASAAIVTAVYFTGAKTARLDRDLVLSHLGEGVPPFVPDDMIVDRDNKVAIAFGSDRAAIVFILGSKAVVQPLRPADIRGLTRSQDGSAEWLVIRTSDLTRPRFDLHLTHQEAEHWAARLTNFSHGQIAA
jgi:hypothetical protein